MNKLQRVDEDHAHRMITPEVRDALWDVNQEELADESPADWWDRQLIGLTDRPAIEAAFELIATVTQDKGRLLEQLVAIGEFSGRPTNTFPRARLLAHAAALEKLADQTDLLELSSFGLGLRSHLKLSESMRERATAVRKLHKLTSRSLNPWLAKGKNDLTRWVDSKIAPRGRTGKRKAQHALSVLISAATLDHHSAAAQRMVVSRLNKRLGKTGPVKHRPLRIGRPQGGALKADLRKQKAKPGQMPD